VTDHDLEHDRGLPERLPDGEHILWQGAPAWRSLAVRLFHLRMITIYFGVLMAWRMASGLADGAAAADALLSAALLLPVLLAAIALFGLLAWLISRSTVYTLTNRRLVMSVGVALPMTINVPFSAVEAAGLRSYGDGSGDISLTPTASQRLGYFVAWPHVRPWRVSRPEPTLRCIPDAARVAQILAAALAPMHQPAPAPTPQADEPAVAVLAKPRPLATAA
jgi:hypothetical protein